MHCRVQTEGDLCVQGFVFDYGKNWKMPISIRYGKNTKIAKCLSQLGMEKRKNLKMFISIRYGKNFKFFLGHPLLAGRRQLYK